MSGRTRVARADELEPGRMKEATLLGRPIVVANVDRRYVAFQNECLHARVRLSEGRLEGDVVICRWHQWRYRTTTGEVLSDESPYATFTTFETFVEDGELFVSHEPLTRICARPQPDHEGDPS
jgi:nitrite reductase/ring-hydroxylating ferredoxin subunit